MGKLIRRGQHQGRAGQQCGTRIIAAEVISIEMFGWILSDERVPRRDAEVGGEERVARVVLWRARGVGGSADRLD